MCKTDELSWTFGKSLTTLHSLGPVARYHENSKYYSAVKPAANKEVDAHLPHITIELPVYKESLVQTMCVTAHNNMSAN